MNLLASFRQLLHHRKGWFGSSAAGVFVTLTVELIAVSDDTGIASVRPADGRA
jgi:hypothetical protein